MAEEMIDLSVGEEKPLCEVYASKASLLPFLLPSWTVRLLD